MDITTLESRIEAATAAALQRVRTAAIWLIAHIQTAQRDIETVETADPAVAAAVAVARSEVAAIRQTNPALNMAMAGIEITAEDVLTEAKAIAAQVPTPPAVLPTPAPPALG
jgi:hypothetical protein